MRKSNTPLIALPYSAGNAPVKKSLLANTLLLSIETGPPLEPKSPKWFGLGMSIPSNRNNKPTGELPRIIISFTASFAPRTPAKFCAMRLTSFLAPANR